MLQGNYPEGNEFKSDFAVVVASPNSELIEGKTEIDIKGKVSVELSGEANALPEKIILLKENEIYTKDSENYDVPDYSKSGLSAGAIAGIVIACVVVVAVVVFLIVWFAVLKKPCCGNKKVEKSEATN